MKSKKRIVYFAVNYYPSKGGTSRVVENLIRKLKYKYDISIICYKNILAKKYIDGVNAIEFPEYKIKGIGVFLFFLRTAIYLFKHGDFDLVHAHKIDCSFTLPLLTKRFRVIATSHESPYLRDKWSLIAKIYFRIMECFFIRSKARLTSISRPLSEYYNRKYKRKVLYIPNGVETTPEINYRKADYLLEDLGIKNDYIVFAGRRIMKTKGCHVLLEALSRINYNKKIVIAGDTTHAPGYVKELKQQYNHLGLYFSGYIDDLDVLLGIISKAKLFVFPSITEGMSLMLLESSLTGTPIIASDIPENMEVFTNEHITFFKNKNASDLADKIRYVMNNYNEAKIKAEKTVAYVKKNYSWEKIAKKYELLYDDIIAGQNNEESRLKEQ
jgi:glycosyltransferase involved in cell wall biosynthesis